MFLLTFLYNYKKFSILSSTLDKDFSKRLIVVDKFRNKLEKYSCEIKDNKDETFKDKDIFYSYKTDGKLCPFEITYIAASNEKLIKNISEMYSNSMENSNGIENSIKYYGVQSKIVEDNKYKIVLYNKVCVLYLKTDIKNKGIALALLDELGYKNKMYK